MEIIPCLVGSTKSELNSEKRRTSSTPQLEIEDPCDDFISVLSSQLTKLDYNLAAGSLPESEDSSELRKLKRNYKKFTSRFIKVGQIKNSVFVYSLVLAKKVQKIVAEKYSFGAGEMLLLYAGCFFLSIKYVIDSEKWFLDDFALVSGYDKASISKIELFLMEECLDFDASVSEKDYMHEYLLITKKVQQRKCSKPILIG